ncbi:hypothetical protein A3I56_01075 [Candidatus Roizmanbacteria bacterium RIFCSPLOWO2_02_FULL_43_10]|uniref:Phosphatidylglycerol lysyltransferase C-terminal domain-containing protein n=2 Tax=Candidatus Roizmaniibacteriota TaxID=1752723 RepID=A0A1F7JW67_9BACT|nr:MAG: hypothetical protein A3D08_01620 [Candidatus Roizmanbacteria bacterium RIFCSPHIGHO2_02_FULL_43_11]OGK59824.1 MAG: hypothetical protein A3I56_01075 [Candidatus Roizmanbacteria bacterium RIFCSPLOWO2_02_FULL_43_10]
MLPTFPDQEKLDIKHALALKKLLDGYPPYSDFNLVSLYSWNVKDDIEVSELYNNIVIKFTDYISCKPYFSFLGKTKVNTTARLILIGLKKRIRFPALKNIPATVAMRISKRRYKIQEDRDNFDYIYNIRNYLALVGSPYKKKRNLIKRYRELHGERTAIKRITLSQPSTQKAILKVFDQWRRTTLKTSQYAKNERRALMRYFTFHTLGKTRNYGFFYDRILIGFACFELLPNRMVMCHFEKIAEKKHGISEFFLYTVLKILARQGYRRINYMQDLGIPGLRHRKTLLRPQKYLKKYIIKEI